MNNALPELVDHASYYLASSFGLRLFDNWEFVMSLVAVLLALAWMISAKISFQAERLQWLNRLLPHGKTLFLILAAIIIIRGSFISPVHVLSNDLQPELINGELILIDKISWGIRLPMSNRLFSYRRPKLNEIVMFNRLNSTKQRVESRLRKIIAVAGDRVLVDFKNSKATIDHDDRKIVHSFQAAANIEGDVLAFAVPRNQVLVASNTLRAQNFSHPDYVSFAQIVGTPISKKSVSH